MGVGAASCYQREGGGKGAREEKEYWGLLTSAAVPGEGRAPERSWLFGLWATAAAPTHRRVPATHAQQQRSWAEPGWG